MRLLIVDQDGCGLSFAWRCSLAGHKVRLFLRKDPKLDPTQGDGFPVTKVDNWLNHVKWAELIFTTNNGKYVPQLDSLKRQGYPYFGPSVASQNLEIKRGEGMDFLRKNGVDVPRFETFKNLKEAESFVWKNEKRWVFKTLGDNEDKSLSYCSKSPADMISRLQRWQKMGMNPKGEVMLQEFIPGIELGVSRWMGKDGWVSDPCLNWEHKKLMSGNYGPNTGEMGTVMVYQKKDKLDDDILNPLEKELLKLGHLGDIDLNCIIDEKGKAWPLEFTNRCGWPAFNLMMEQHKGDPCNWMRDAILGKRSLEVSYEVGVCVVLAQPDFPYSDRTIEEKQGIPIYGVTKSNQRHIQPQGVRIENMPDMEGEKVIERPIWTTAGEYVAVVTSLGPTVNVSRNRAYKTVKEVQIPDMIVRDDIGKGLEESLPKLQKMGYCKEIRWQ
jgi:phosphoribosylamine--glycine ligase